MNPYSPTILTDLLTNFIHAFSLGFSNIYNYALYFVGALVTIEIAWFGIKWALGSADGVKELVPKIVTIGFFVFLTKQYVGIVDSILQSFVQAGLAAGNNRLSSAEFLDPAALMMHGFKASKPLWDSVFEGGVLATVFSGPRLGATLLCSLVLCISFFIMAMQVILVVIEFYVVTSVGILFIPFGINRHTSFLADRVIAAIITNGLKIMVLAFISSIVFPLVEGFSWKPEFELRDLSSVAAGSFAIAIIMWRAPAMAASMMTGSAGLNAGNSFVQPIMGGVSTVMGFAGTSGLSGSSASSSAGSTTQAAAINRDTP